MPAECPIFLESQNVTHVLTIKSTQLKHKSSHIKYTFLKLDDVPSESIENLFPAAEKIYKSVLNKNGIRLVHCEAGASRSATIILFLMMKFESRPLDAAWDCLKKLRPRICPNFGFMMALVKEEQILLESGHLSQSSPNFLARYLLQTRYNGGEELGLTENIMMEALVDSQFDPSQAALLALQRLEQISSNSS